MPACKNELRVSEKTLKHIAFTLALNSVSAIDSMERINNLEENSRAICRKDTIAAIELGIHDEYNVLIRTLGKEPIL